MNDDDTCDRNRLESIEQLGTYSSKAEVTPLMGREFLLTEWIFFGKNNDFLSGHACLNAFFFPNCSPGNLGKIVQLIQTLQVYHCSSKSCKKKQTNELVAQTPSFQHKDP